MEEEQIYASQGDNIPSPNWTVKNKHLGSCVYCTCVIAPKFYIIFFFEENFVAFFIYKNHNLQVKCYYEKDVICLGEF